MLLDHDNFYFAMISYWNPFEGTLVKYANANRVLSFVIV